MVIRDVAGGDQLFQTLIMVFTFILFNFLVINGDLAIQIRSNLTHYYIFTLFLFSDIAAR